MMSLKYCLILVFALCLCSAQRDLRITADHRHSLEHVTERNEIHSQPGYSYLYGVDDMLFRDSTSQIEEHTGNIAHKSNPFRENDGSHRIVEYQAGPQIALNPAVIRLHGHSLLEQSATQRYQSHHRLGQTQRQADYDTEVVESIEQYPSGQQPQAPQIEYSQPSPIPQPQPVIPQPQPIFPQPSPISEPVVPQPQPIFPQPVPTYPESQPTHGGIYPAGTQPLSPSTRLNFLHAYTPIFQRFSSQSVDTIPGQNSHFAHNAPDFLSRNLQNYRTQEIGQVSMNDGFTGYGVSVNKHGDSFIFQDPRIKNVQSENGYNSEFAYSRASNEHFSAGHIRTPGSELRSNLIQTFQDNQFSRTDSRDNMKNSRNSYESLSTSFKPSRLVFQTQSANRAQVNSGIPQNAHVSVATPVIPRRTSVNQDSHSTKSHLSSRVFTEQEHSIVAVTPRPFSYTPLVHPFELIA